MAESRLVPSNLMAWPRIRDLLPDQKLIVYHKWATCPQACGCFLLDLGAFQGALNITAPALQDALREFQRRTLVTMDEKTGEVFILDWFRFHKFNSPSRRRLLEDSIKRIQSPTLRSIVEKSAGCALREGKEREGKKTTPSPPPKQMEDPPNGGQGGGGSFDFDELQDALAYQAKTRGKPSPEGWAASAVRRCRKEGIGPGEKEAIQAWKRHVENQKKSEQQAAETRSSGKPLQPPNWKAGLPENLRSSLPPGSGAR